MRKMTIYFPIGIAYFFILLFCYASISKILDFENFQVQIAQSPLLSAYAGLVSYATIILELIIAAFLLVPKLRLIGLYASLGMMSAFTVYIYLILNYSDFVPCSCGGILEKLGWTEHLIFNIICILVATASIIIFEKHSGRKMLNLGMTIISVIVFFSAIIVYLFYSSEYIIKEQNNFTRRFPHHPVIMEKTYDLKYNSYYFAGSTKNKIFLANPTSPFLLLAMDQDLSVIDTIKLIPDQPHTYRSVKTMVTDNYISMYDGNVPVIYRSRLDDFSGKVFQISFQDVYFDQLVSVGNNSFVFRTTSTKTGSLVLGNLSLNVPEKVKLNTEILEKQADGVFDVDGKLLYDSNDQEVRYVYSYRNQVINTDRDLQNIRHLKTIDTISRPQITITQLSDGSRKMSRPPIVINKNSTVHDGILFIQSSTMGRYESKDLWNKNDIVDVYDTDLSKYWGSFYVQRRGNKKMSQMLVTDQYLFVLAGQQITRYRIAQTLTRNFKNGGKLKTQ